MTEINAMRAATGAAGMSIERNARLLERVPLIGGADVRRDLPRQLAAAGLTIAPIEPTDEQIGDMAAALEDAWSKGDRQWTQLARAAYPAAIKGDGFSA